MKIIVFSGVGNTGKNYLIRKFKEKGFKALGGNASSLLRFKDNPVKFQKEILKKEKERINELMKDFTSGYMYDNMIFINRTVYDNYIYYLFNLGYGTIKTRIKEYSDINKYVMMSKKLYDRVILFNKPFKKSNTFLHYNSNGLNKLFDYFINSVYNKKVTVYGNSYDFIKNDELGKLLK